MAENLQIVQNNLPVINMARLNITYNGQNGDLPDLIEWDTPVENIRQVATEAVRNGYIPGIDRVENATFAGFKVEKYPANEGVPYNRIILRPETPFGA